MLKSAAVLLLVLTTILFAGCSTEPDQTPGPNLYTDREVKAFIELFPTLASEFGGDQLPEDVLDRLKLDTTALKVIDTYAGGCIDFVVYELSPSYELVVDDNVCSGQRVYIRNK